MPSRNPFWFGYYPGDRPVQRPRYGQNPKYGFPDFSDVGLGAFVDSIDKAVDDIGDAPAELPKKVWEWVKKDLKSSFSVGASPSTKVGAHELYQYEGGETADVSGVYAEVNLYELVTNPVKTTKQFFTKTLFDPLNPFRGLLSMEGEFWTDLGTLGEIRAMRALLRQDGTQNVAGFDFMKESVGPLNLNEHKIFAKSEIKGKSLLDGSDVSVEAEIDVYQQVAENTLGFVAGKRSSLTRNKSYRSFSTSVIKAAATELELKRSDLEVLFGSDPQLGRELSMLIDGFLDESKLLENLGNVDKSLGNLLEYVSKKSLTSSISISDITPHIELIGNSVDKSLEKINQIRNRLSSGPTADPLALKRFNTAVREMEDYLRDVRSFTYQYLSRSTTDTFARIAGGEFLISKIGLFNNRFKNDRYDGGVYDRYIASIGYRYFNGPKSLLDIDFSDPKDPNVGFFSEGYRSLGFLYRYNKAFYLQEAGRDLIDTFNAGKIPDQFFWFGSLGDLYIGGKRIPLSKVGMLKTRIQMFTPGYWVRQTLARTQNLGLTYDESMEGRVFHPIFNKLPWVFKNKFTEEFDYKVGGRVAGRIKATFEGSKDLGSFYKVWEAAEDGRLVFNRSGNQINWLRDTNINDRAKLALLNGDSSILTGVEFLPVEKPEEFLASLAKVRTDLISKLGLEVDAAGKIVESEENLAKLNAFFGRLKFRVSSKAHLSPFQSKFGILEIYASKVSIIQQKIYTKLGLHKLSQAAAQLRIAIRQKIAHLASKISARIVSKLGTSVLGAASGGIALVVAPIVEKILQATIAKLIDVSKKLLRATLRGDLSRVLNDMMNDTAKTFEKVMACGCLAPTFLVLGVLMMGANMLSAISPLDLVKSGLTALVSNADPLRPGNINASECVGPNPIITCYSYNVGIQRTRPGDGPCRHGDNIYPDGSNDCTFTIPYFAGDYARGPLSDPSSVCNNTNPKRSYYGYALDLTFSNPNQAWVYAPKVGNVTEWKTKKRDMSTCLRCPSTIGCSIILTGNDPDHIYKVFLLHLDCADLHFVSNKITPGTPISKLSEYRFGKHVHIEMTVDGSYVKPEDYLCK